MAGIENSARNFGFLVIIRLNRRACVCCSVKSIFAVFLTVGTIEQDVINENLFTYTAVVGFKARRRRVIRAARKLKAGGHNILDSLIAVCTVYYRIFARTDFGLIDISSSGRIGCCFAAFLCIHARSEHCAAVNIVTTICTWSVDRKSIASYKKCLRNRCSRRVNHYRICKLNYVVIVFFCSFGSLIVDKVTVINRITVYFWGSCSEFRIGIGNNRVGFRAHKLKRYADIALEVVKVNGTVV